MMPRFPSRACLLLFSAMLPAAGAFGSDDVTAVSSRASADYVRARLPDGSFQPETYAFGEGGRWAGDMADATIDGLHFTDVAQVIAAPLAAQHYVPSRDIHATRLLIMVYWGTTRAPEHASDSQAYKRVFDLSNAMKGPPTISNPAGRPGFQSEQQLMAAMDMVDLENDRRERTDQQNAAMLGYDSWWAATTMHKDLGFGLDFEWRDMIDELERDRYFVVLMAYDFRLLWKEKRHKLLWETRFSIDQHHNAFDRALPAMAKYASQYFGQDSNGLLHATIPLGHVAIGPLKSLGSEPAK